MFSVKASRQQYRKGFKDVEVEDQMEECANDLNPLALGAAPNH